MIMLSGRDWGAPAGGNAPAPKWVETNSTPAVKKSKPKKEEEISIEDIPF